MKKFSRVISYKKNGNIYLRGSINGQKFNWNEHINKDGYHTSFIKINDIKTKNDVFNINNYIDCCNNNNVDDLFIYMKNPNIKLLVNNLENVKYSNEELNINNISIDNYDILNDFYSQNKEKILDVNKILSKKFNSLGKRNIVISSFYIDEFNYNSNNLLNIINFIKVNELKSSLIYNITDENFIISKEHEPINNIKNNIYNINNIYNLNIDMLDYDPNDIDKLINIKVDNFNNFLHNFYEKDIIDYNNYTLNIYIKWEHFIDQHQNEKILNKLNINILKLKNIYKFNFNLFLPNYIKYLLKPKLTVIKYN